MTSTLRIGIDGRAFGSPAGGVRRYVRGLVAGFSALDAPPVVVALGGDPATWPDGMEGVPEGPHPPTNAGWMLVGLPRAASQGRVDVLHAPSYTAPFWSAMPVVLTVHDVSYARHPEWYPYRRDPIRRAFYRRSVRAATAILTDSAFSASEIHAAYGVPMGQITVAPLGVDRVFAGRPPRPAGFRERDDESADGDLPAEVTTPFVLHVGDLHERRNLPLALDAVLEARRQFGACSALSLVLAGADRGVGDALCDVAARADAPEAVVRLGVVEESRLIALYHAAVALVYPSLYEGFGLPVLEAMACGTPVIASRAASMPEVLGDAGILLDPRDDRAWVEAIVRVVNDAALRHRMREHGLARAALFTWEHTARVTQDVYRRVAGRV